jgi:hypothetical protein
MVVGVDNTWHSFEQERTRRALVADIQMKQRQAKLTGRTVRHILVPPSDPVLIDERCCMWNTVLQRLKQLCIPDTGSNLRRETGCSDEYYKYQLLLFVLRWLLFTPPDAFPLLQGHIWSKKTQ